MSNQLVQRETKVMDAFELSNIKHQVASLFDKNEKKMEAFKTRILKISLNPMLSNCTPESVIRCGLRAQTIGLSLESGQGYIVNYAGSAQFDCGYKGWQILAERAGFSVVADVVYSCDDFSQSGFGFNTEMIFNPDHKNRNIADDKWAKKNLTGVIVSIKKNDTNEIQHAFVPADMIHKIVGKSPSTQSENARKYSPHENWTHQMFAAKAIKQVISKMPIDLSEATQGLHGAISAVNQTEAMAQTQNNSYAQERFDKNFPQWVELVSSGQKKPMAIITQLSNAFNLTEEQLEKAMTLKRFEPIEGEVQREAG